MRDTMGIPAPFLDMAFGIIFVFLAVVLVSTTEQPRQGMPTAAEFLITLEWDDGSEDDCDLYVRGPDGQVVFYSNRQTPYMSLDMDNMGSDNTTVMPDGKVIDSKARKETVAVRAIVPGEYMVNGHLYSKRSAAGIVDHLKAQVVKVNPYKDILTATAEFDTQGQETTFGNFIVGEDGQVTKTFLAPEKLVGVPQ